MPFGGIPERLTAARRSGVRCVAAATGDVTILDLIRDLEEYPARDLYRAARMLVRKGLVERQDVSYAELGCGRNRKAASPYRGKVCARVGDRGQQEMALNVRELSGSVNPLF